MRRCPAAVPRETLPAASAEMFGEVVRRLRPSQQQRRPPHVRQGARLRASLSPSRFHSATSSAARPSVDQPQPKRRPQTPKNEPQTNHRDHNPEPSPLSSRIITVINPDKTHKANPTTAQPVPQRSDERTPAHARRDKHGGNPSPVPIF